MTVDPLTLLVDGLTCGLASHRITRLIVADKVWLGTRTRLRSWLRVHGDPKAYVTVAGAQEGELPVYGSPGRFLAAKADEAISCGQCMGVWVSVATVAAWHYGGPRTRAGIRAAAVVGVQSILVSKT